METRYIIVQYATMLEELCSFCLCELLQINKESSISFGYGSQSLSFNAKINLIVDLKETNKDLKTKFALFAEIRNKFAHVFKVSSFHTFCDLGVEWKNKATKLLKFYEIENIDDEESRFITAYILLYKELEAYLMQISLDNARKRGFEKGTLQALKIFKEIVSKELLSIPEGIDIMNKFYKGLK